MQIGSWPGALNGNPFLEIHAATLESHGARFIPIESPSNRTVARPETLLIQWPDQIFQSPFYPNLIRCWQHRRL